MQTVTIDPSKQTTSGRINSLALDLARSLWMIKKAYITHEVQAYIIDTNNNNDLSPLEW